MKTARDKDATRKSTVEIDRLFFALGDSTRRAILTQLVERPYSGTHLAQSFGITLTAVMQHLKLLEEVRLVHTEKVGRVRTCRLEPEGFDVLERWIGGHRTAWQRKFDRLADMLGEDGEER